MWTHILKKWCFNYLFPAWLKFLHFTLACTISRHLLNTLLLFHLSLSWFHHLEHKFFWKENQEDYIWIYFSQDSTYKGLMKQNCLMNYNSDFIWICSSRKISSPLRTVLTIRDYLDTTIVLYQFPPLFPKHQVISSLLLILAEFQEGDNWPHQFLQLNETLSHVYLLSFQGKCATSQGKVIPIALV